MTDLPIRTSLITRQSDDLAIVELVLADNADTESAESFIRFRTVVKCGEDWRLAAIQREALRNAQTAITEEFQRTSKLANRQPS